MACPNFDWPVAGGNFSRKWGGGFKKMNAREAADRVALAEAALDAILDSAIAERGRPA